MKSDFCEYEKNPHVCPQCYEMKTGVDKETNKRVIIATWAMLMRQPPEWYKPFNCFIIDESHQASSPALTKIISNLSHVPFRFGFTGTLDGSKTHEMQCRAWLGPIVKTKSTRDLIDEGFLSDLKIKSVELRYPTQISREVSKYEYQDEIQWLVTNQKRNQYIVDLAVSQEKNTLVLFNLIEHGKVLYDMAASLHGDNVKWIIGDIQADEREKIRRMMEKESGLILFATYGTLSQGVNIRNLHNLILAHPFKARIRNLQSIGRLLRKQETKNSATVYDLCDNLCYKKSQNTVYKHYVQRLAIYESEGFPVTFTHVEIV